MRWEQDTLFDLPPREKKRRAVIVSGDDALTFAAMAAVRTLRSYADEYATRLTDKAFGTPLHRAAVDARRVIGQAFFRAIGAVTGDGPEASGSATELWGTLEGHAEGQAARDEVLAGQEAYRALTGVEVSPKQGSPGAGALLAWHARQRPAEAPPTIAPAPPAPPKKRRARKVAA